MNNPFVITTLIVCLGLFSCSEEKENNIEPSTSNATEIPASTELNSFISIFEIPATDISRAIDFYQSILGINIEKMEMEGMKMGIFPYEGQAVAGVIMEGEGYNPSADGVTIYLNGGENLQIILDKVEENGGKILVPKTAHADESGYFALFLDSEGNKMGLNSPN